MTHLLLHDTPQYASERGLAYVGNPDVTLGGAFMAIHNPFEEKEVPAVRVGATMIDKTVIVEHVTIQIPVSDDRRVRALFHSGVEKKHWEDPVYLSWACLTYGYQLPVFNGRRPRRQIYAFTTDPDHEDMEVKYLSEEDFCQVLEREWLARLLGNPR